MPNTRHPYVSALLTWFPVIAGMLVLYAPTLLDLVRGPWSDDGQMHGPAVLGISLWLRYRN